MFAVAACGDPRVNFVGHYTGTLARSIGTSNFSDTADITITLETGGNGLQFNRPCNITGKTVTDTEMQFDAVSCPSRQGTSVSGLMATYTDSYNDGTATLAGKTLTATLNGTEVGSNYSDGSSNRSFDFTDTVTMTRQ